MMEPVGGGTKSIKAVGECVADVMLRILTPRRYRTGIPDIDDYHPLFDILLPMI